MGTPWTAVARMMSNAVGETLPGSVPVVGSLSDSMCKAVQHNARLLLDDQGDPARVRGRGIGVVIPAGPGPVVARPAALAVRS